jgi:glutathione S-transferase
VVADVQGRNHVVQWCFAAVSTVEPTLVCIDFIEIFDSGKAAHKLNAEARKLAGCWLGDVERRSKTASGSPAPISRRPNRMTESP